MSLKSGTRLLNYSLVDKLGERGMGEVYRATDTILEREVAIKLLPETLSSHTDRLERFEREAKLLASLNHPNIAAVYGLHEGPEGERFIAMEFVPGEDLAAVLARGPLSVERALSFAAQIAEALEAAHEQGVIHRDLKPGSDVVTPDDRVKVFDFGLAKSFDLDPGSSSTNPSISPTLTSAGTAAGMILGSAAYMSPEQVLLEGENNLRTADWTANGTMVFREQIPGKGMDLMSWSQPGDESTIEILLDTEDDEISPSVSPNGRWLAYVSNQSGRDEVYVTAFPKPEGIAQVSIAGGANPAWSADGSKLFYFQGREFIAVRVTTDPDVRVAGRKTLFEVSFRQYRWQRQYDAPPDGEHFVMIADPPGGHIEVILNRFTELKSSVDGNH